MNPGRATSVEQYIEWIRQARFEVEDLRACLEFELEDLARFPAFLDPLAEGIETLYQSMETGTYAFGREDLPFMDLVHRFGDEIPFHILLKQINETHRHGLEVDTNDA